MTRFNRIIQHYHRIGKKEATGGGRNSIVKVYRGILQRLISWYYHCDIPSTAEIDGVYFCHSGFGVVINPKTKIGEGTVIQHRVTIGEIGEGVPVIGKNCYIGAGAIIIGGITIGDNVKIGAGAVVVHDVPTGATVVGVAARVI